MAISISSSLARGRSEEERRADTNSLSSGGPAASLSCNMPNDLEQSVPDDFYGTSAVDLRRFVRSQLHGVRRGDDIEVEDIVQEAFLRAWATRDRDDIKNSKGYLFRIAKNLIIDIGRRRDTQPFDKSQGLQHDLAVEAAGSVHLTPERYVSAQQDLEIVQHTIDRLPDNCREAFCRQRKTGETYAKVASALNMSESMVQKHMARALLALHKALP